SLLSVHTNDFDCRCCTSLLFCRSLAVFLFSDTATTEIYTLSLHDALPILAASRCRLARRWASLATSRLLSARALNWPSAATNGRSEEHTSELQSRENLVCRLLLEKKKAVT